MRCGVLHRWLVVPLAAAALLYGGASALASEPESAVPAPAPAPPPLEAPVPLPPGERMVVPAPGERAVVSRPSAAPDGLPHIALLLPLESKAFVRHAEAVRDGFFAAAKVQGGG